MSRQNQAIHARMSMKAVKIPVKMNGKKVIYSDGKTYNIKGEEYIAQIQDDTLKLLGETEMEFKKGEEMGFPLKEVKEIGKALTKNRLYKINGKEYLYIGGSEFIDLENLKTTKFNLSNTNVKDLGKDFVYSEYLKYNGNKLGDKWIFDDGKGNEIKIRRMTEDVGADNKGDIIITEEEEGRMTFTGRPQYKVWRVFDDDGVMIYHDFTPPPKDFKKDWEKWKSKNSFSVKNWKIEDFKNAEKELESKIKEIEKKAKQTPPPKLPNLESVEKQISSSKPLFKVGKNNAAILRTRGTAKSKFIVLDGHNYFIKGPWLDTTIAKAKVTDKEIRFIDVFNNLTVRQYEKDKSKYFSAVPARYADTDQLDEIYHVDNLNDYKGLGEEITKIRNSIYGPWYNGERSYK